jgi:glycosylphosphatidylinositol transamidase (GPIT) subunit GPI8
MVEVVVDKQEKPNVIEVNTIQGMIEIGQGKYSKRSAYHICGILVKKVPSWLTKNRERVVYT